MNYNKVFSFFSNLNTHNTDQKAFYKEINDFNNVHFIPAVSLEVANFLKWITYLIKPKKILEIGFGSGTSALFIHKGFNKYKKFYSLERDKNRYFRGIELFKKLNINSINLKYFNSFDFFKINKDKFDLIFLDGIKREYYLHIDPVKKKLNKNGLFICDNVLFGGKILENKVENKYKKGVKYINLFIEILLNDLSFNTYFLPIGDGLSISIKK